MNPEQRPIQAVPTNIITGFLGAGKTSAILHWLQQKPSHERWAILVNEFGEIGVDGSLFQGQYSEDQGVFIREVPGGCMCCAAGLPMQVALNQLLKKARPDRLLIEPTGLGHPKEVLQVLSSAHYRDVISLQKTLTLLDARKLSDARYTDHATFNQQIAIADTIIANKSDLYASKDKENLIAYVKHKGVDSNALIFTQQGEVELSQLYGAAARLSPITNQAHHGKTKALAADLPMPKCGFIKAQNKGEGFYSIGWRISEKIVFSHTKLLSFFAGLQVERMKGVLITDEGIYGYNLTADELTEVALDDSIESRIEIICHKKTDHLHEKLFSCVMRTSTANP